MTAPKKYDNARFVGYAQPNAHPNRVAIKDVYKDLANQCVAFLVNEATGAKASFKLTGDPSNGPMLQKTPIPYSEPAFKTAISAVLADMVPNPDLLKASKAGKNKNKNKELIVGYSFPIRGTDLVNFANSKPGHKCIRCERNEGIYVTVTAYLERKSGGWMCPIEISALCPICRHSYFGVIVMSALDYPTKKGTAATQLLPLGVRRELSRRVFNLETPIRVFPLAISLNGGIYSRRRWDFPTDVAGVGIDLNGVGTWALCIRSNDWNLSARAFVNQQKHDCLPNYEHYPGDPTTDGCSCGSKAQKSGLPDYNSCKNSSTC